MSQTVQMSPWLGGTYTLQGNSMACREAINMYLQSGEGLAKYQSLVKGTSGTQLLVDLASDIGSDTLGCRGMWLTSASPYPEGNLYWAFGSKIGYTYKDPISGQLHNKVLYDIGLSTTRVSITDNGFEVVFATGTNMVVADIFNDVVTDITSTLPFKYPTQVVYLMGRVCAISGDPSTATSKSLQDAAKSNVIWYSGLADAKSWGAADFTAADLSADPILAIQIRQGDLWAFGPRTYQIFTVTEDPNNPLAYAPGSGTYVGCNAPYSACSIGDSVFWLGSNASGRNVVFRGVGYNSTRISDHGIESQITKLAELSNKAYGFAYQDSGHLFYVLTIPPGNYTFEGSTVYSEGKTLVFDTLTEQWHERASREPKTGILQAWQPLFSSFAWGKIIVGNLLWPALMELRDDVYTDYDPTTVTKTKPILRRFQGPVYFQDLQKFIIQEFLADIVVGHGPLNGVSAKPVCQLQVSWDSGNTWGNIMYANMPLVGNYAGRVRWLRLGSGRNAVIRLTFTENMQFMMGEARIRTEKSVNP